MKKQYNVAIIGAGHGMRVHLPAWNSIRGVRVRALVDPDPEVARSAVESRCVERVCSDYGDVIRDPHVDIVSVAVPPHEQFGIVCESLDEGKHVLCEKPFGVSLGQSEEMLSRALRAEIVHAVGLQFRYEPGIVALASVLRGGTLGSILRVNVAWLTGGRSDPSRPWSWQHDEGSGGGVLNAFATHVLDYLEWFTSDRIRCIDGRTDILISRRVGAAGVEVAVSAEDSADFICGFESGAVGQVCVSNCYPSVSFHRIEVFCERGCVEFMHRWPFGIDDVSVQMEFEGRGKVPVEIRGTETGHGDTRVGPLACLARSFVERIQGVDVDLPTFRSGRRIRQLIHEMRVNKA